ncbi:MAG TPA: SPOR domain-containing protein [Bacteroidales bacterium]|nr:SPOR domain-containing protein [Bacteroidales bacterium]HRW96596.1 SPOR domain-containing protein [Bacteroidales bacterium]
MEISKYIAELLHDHDCVIIPGFGGFVCNYQPAQIHPGQHSFYPPAKKILFNKELRANDGLLASHAAIRQNISFEEAVRQLEETAQDFIFRIESGERIKLEKIGVLFQDIDANIQFEQDFTENYLKDAFGLSTFISPPIQRSLRHTAPAFTAPVPYTEKSNNLRRAAFWSTGIAAAFLIFGLMVINFNGVNQFIKNETGLFHFYQPSGENQTHLTEPVNNPGQTISLPLTSKSVDQTIENKQETIPASSVEKEIPDDVVENATTDQHEPVAIAATSPAPEAEPINPPEKVNIRMYHLIAGSFEKAENADELITSFAADGYDPKIIGQAANGYYRVSIAAYLKKNDALDELEKVRRKYNPNIWLLRQ